MPAVFGWIPASCTGLATGQTRSPRIWLRRRAAHYSQVDTAGGSRLDGVLGGVTVFDSGTGGNVGDAHGSYFNSSESLGDMGNIISGDYGAVVAPPWYQVPVF